MNEWLEKKDGTSRYLDHISGRWRISKVNPRNPIYTLWDLSDGPAKFIANFKTLEEAQNVSAKT